MADLVVEPPSPRAVAMEGELLFRISQSDATLDDLESLGRSNKPLRMAALADTFVWSLSSNGDSVVPDFTAEVLEALAAATPLRPDRVSLTAEVQCLLAWKNRSVIEAITDLADGGRLGAEYRRWYAHRLRRVQCGLPRAAFIDQRLDQYTRIVSGEEHVFAWAAALFAALAVPSEAGLGAVHAVQLAAVNRLVWSYCTNVVMYRPMYANVLP